MSTAAQSLAAFNVGDVPQEEIPAALSQVLTVGAALIARLVVVPQTSQAPTTDPLLTAEQVALQIALPVPRVYELARQGSLPFVRIGKKLVRFEQSALNSWIAARRQGKEPGTLPQRKALTLSRQRGRL